MHNVFDNRFVVYYVVLTGASQCTNKMFPNVNKNITNGE